MKGLTVVGVVLIVLGILGFIFGGISFTKDEKVADLGPLEIEKQEKKSIPVTPIASGIAVVAGIVMVIAGSRKS